MVSESFDHFCFSLGGDIVSGDGKGSISIYGNYFEDEYLEINHTAPGFLAMANRGPNTNGCQFYITTMATPWLDGKHTIFGKVIRGQGYVHGVEKVVVFIELIHKYTERKKLFYF